MKSLSFPEAVLSPPRGPGTAFDVERTASALQPPLDALALSHYFWLFRRYAWRIALVVAIAMGLAALYCIRVQPVYEATARIAIDPHTPSSGIGQQESFAGPSDIDQVMATETQLIQSDEVLRPVVLKFHLPLAGETQAPTQQWPHGGDGAADGIGEAPVALPHLSVTHLANSLLIDIHYRSTDRRQAAAVANAIAQSYIAHTIEGRARASVGVSQFMEEQISQLKQKMDDSSLALAGYEREMGVINPDEKVSILTARVLQLNTQYTSAEDDRINKEAEYRELHSGATPTPAVPLSGAALEVSSQAAALSRQEQQLHDAEEKLAIAKTVYGPNYAEYKRAANDVAELNRQYQLMRTDISKRIEVSYRESLAREAMLRNALREAKDESDHLNAHSAQYQELKREAEANTSLYDELYQKIKEAGINAGIESSSIRIADMARPPAFPIFPNKTLLIASAGIFSFLFSLLAIVILDLADKRLRDPDQVMRLTGMQVIGILPDVRAFPAYHRPLAMADGARIPDERRAEIVKQWLSSEEHYRESIASLLSTLLLSRSAGSLRSLLITSASTADGKSSCAAHLAAEHSHLGKKTLLIDADMRSPFHHGFFGLNNEAGVYSAIRKQASLSEIRQRVVGSANLDVVVAGPSNPEVFRHVGRAVSELLRQALLDGYDLVIVDAPPMIGLTEPIEIACLTGGVLVIGDARHTHRQDVSSLYATLDRVRANVLGIVLNRFCPDMGSSQRQYRNRSIYAGGLKNTLA